MKLEGLTLRACDYEYDGRKKGRYYGEAVFTSELGSVKLNLDPDTSDRILAVCADKLIDASKTVAEQMSASILPALTGTSVRVGDLKGSVVLSTIPQEPVA